MRLFPPLSKIAAAFVMMAALSLSACGGGTAPETHFYRLTPVNGIAPRQGGPLPGAAEVQPLRSEGMISGRAILVGESPAVIKGYSYHSWWQSPGVMLQESLIDALRQARAFTTVAGPEMKVDRTYDVLGRIRRLEQNGDHVVVELELTLRLARGGPPLLLKSYHEEAPAGDSVESAVEGFSAAVGRIWARFIADLATVAPAAAAPATAPPANGM
jgi:ABC-type uncharacterized transport system auxiliary subunit